MSRIINYTVSLILFVSILTCLVGCLCPKRNNLTVRTIASAIYFCENGDRVEAGYYSLGDGSLNFVKIKMPDGSEYTLPQALSASGARYTNDTNLVWWIKGDSARAEIRDSQGNWQLKYETCLAAGRLQSDR